MTEIDAVKSRISTHLINLLESFGISNGILLIVGKNDSNSILLPESRYEQIHLSSEGGGEDQYEVFAKTNIKTVFSAVIVFDFGKQEVATNSLETLHKICNLSKIPLITCIPNIAYKDNVFQLISGVADGGGFLFPLSSCSHSGKSLDAFMENEGYIPFKNNDYCLESSSQFIKQENTLLSRGTLAYQYLDWLKSLTDSSSNSLVLIRAYALAAIPQQKIQDRGRFLTVITRTQGKRLAELRETLLCLTAQTNTNFEVLIIGHKVNNKDQENVKRLIGETPQSIRGRIHYVALDEGNRSAPLNLGFSLAKSEYVSILDDDDLVMDNWVEAFWDISQKQPGSLLHAYAVGQNWKQVQLLDGLAATSKPSNDFCHPFDYIVQLHLNRCPTMSLAFPVWLFQNTDIRFDETLDTTEDWDFLMRTAFIAGVVDTPEVTSIYRLWQNTSTSHTLHQRKEWLENEECVRRKLNRIPIILPKGHAGRLQELHLCAYNSEQAISQVKFNHSLSKIDAVLYADDGAGFRESLSFRSENNVHFPKFKYTYVLRKDDSGDCSSKGSFRFDPSEQAGVVVDSFSASLVDKNGTTITVNQQEAKHNGYRVKNHLVFLKQDPQIYFSIPVAFNPEKIIICGNISTKISDATIDAVVGVPLLKRLFRKIKKVGR